MLYCEKCKVEVAGNKECCPLCQGELKGTGEAVSDVFPDVPKEKVSSGLLFRLISFISIAAIIICVAVNLMAPTKVWWSLYAGAGIFCAWITGAVSIAKRHNFIKNITYQLFILSILLVLWDHFTGGLGWSLDYVIPCTCAAVTIFFAVMVFTRRIRAEEYIVYILIDCLYGAVPAVFLFTGVLNIVYPSVVCVALSIMSIAALFLFKGKTIREEIVKKLHL